MPPAPEMLLTARLVLSRPVPADIDAIFAITGDPRACRYNPSDLLTSRAAAEELYGRWDTEWRTRGVGYFVVRRRDGEATLGFCGVKVVRRHGAEVLNLFYRLAPVAWGDGIGPEAATAVVAWAGAVAPGMPVIARVNPANLASQRTAVRAGLHRAPHLDDNGEDGPDLLFTSSGRPRPDPGPSSLRP